MIISPCKVWLIGWNLRFKLCVCFTYVFYPKGSKFPMPVCIPQPQWFSFHQSLLKLLVFFFHTLWGFSLISSLDMYWVLLTDWMFVCPQNSYVETNPLCDSIDEVMRVGPSWWHWCLDKRRLTREPVLSPCSHKEAALWGYSKNVKAGPHRAHPCWCLDLRFSAFITVTKYISIV